MTTPDPTTREGRDELRRLKSQLDAEVNNLRFAREWYCLQRAWLETSAEAMPAAIDFIDTLIAERDESDAEAERMRKINVDLVNSVKLEHQGVARLVLERDAKDAEIERLRPYEEQWQTAQRYVSDANEAVNRLTAKLNALRDAVAEVVDVESNAIPVQFKMDCMRARIKRDEAGNEIGVYENPAGERLARAWRESR